MTPQQTFVRNNKAVAELLLEDRIAKDYVTLLVDPEEGPLVGVPEPSVGSRPTGLMRSVMTFEVPVNFNMTNAADNGKFGVIINPALGDASAPRRFKAAMVDTTGGDWGPDFSSPLAFARVIGGKTLTVDPASRTLVQPPPSYYEAYGENTPAVYSQSPLGAAGTYTVNATTNDEQNFNVGGATLVVVGATTATLTLPPGQYTLSLETTYAATLDNNGSFPEVIPVTPANGKVSVQNMAYGTVDQDAGSAQFVLSVFNVATQFTIQWNAAQGNPTCNWATDVTLNNSWARPDQLQTPAPGYPLSGGPVREYVPVACSCLATFHAPSLTVNGSIGAAYLEPSVCAEDVFTSQPRFQVGNPLEINNLRTFPGAYDGALINGAYCVWGPRKKSLLSLKTPDDAAVTDWGCICISGQASTTDTSLTSTVVLRCKVVTVYQFATDVTLFDLRPRPGLTSAEDSALMLFASFPKASANGKHWDNFRRFLNKIGTGVGEGIQFIESNQNWIRPALNALMTGLMAV